MLNFYIRPTLSDSFHIEDTTKPKNYINKLRQHQISENQYISKELWISGMGADTMNLKLQMFSPSRNPHIYVLNVAVLHNPQNLKKSQNLYQKIIVLDNYSSLIDIHIYFQILALMYVKQLSNLMSAQV